MIWAEKRIRCWSKCNYAIGSVGQLKRLDNDGNATDAWADNCIFILTILENQRNKTKCNNLIKDDELWRSKSK